MSYVIIKKAQPANWKDKWVDAMDKYVGWHGDQVSKGELGFTIIFPDKCKWNFPPSCVVRFDSFSVDTKVCIVMATPEWNDWVEEMEGYVGKNGFVVNTNRALGKYKVRFNDDTEFWFPSYALKYVIKI